MSNQGAPVEGDAEVESTLASVRREESFTVHLGKTEVTLELSYFLHVLFSRNQLPLNVMSSWIVIQNVTPCMFL